jgi:hypothetical protein
MKTLTQYINEAKSISKSEIEKIHSDREGISNGEFSEDIVNSVIDGYIKYLGYKKVKCDKKGFDVKLESPEWEPGSSNHTWDGKKYSIYFITKKDKWGNDPFWEKQYN